MAIQVLKNAKVLLGGFNASGFLNTINLAYNRELIDGTTFGPTLATRQRVAGLNAVDLTLNGYYDTGAAGGFDLAEFTEFSAETGQGITVAPETGVANEKAFFFNALRASYNLAGSVGEIFAADIAAQGKGGDPLVKGTILEDDAVAKTVTGNGTGRNVGAVASGETIYAICHCLAFNATSIDVVIDSDDNSGFTSAAPAVLTFPQFTGTGVSIQKLAGPLTDDWWRASWTLVGTSATIFVVIGIV